MKKTVLIIILALASFGAYASVLAFTPIDLNIKPNINIDPNVVAAYHKAWCEKVQAKVTEKHENFEEKKGNHLDAYENLWDRLNTLIGRLEDKGYDTAQLEQDLQKLDAKIDKFSNDYDAYREKSNEAKGYACDKTKVELQAKLGEVKTALKTLKKDSQDIRNFYKNQIRPDILQLKNQNN